MKYAVVFEKSATGYAAYVPDLPGCVTTGKTLVETERLIGEAIEFHIESLRDHGEIYISFMGDLPRQLKDTPDGSKVRLNFTNDPNKNSL